MPWTTYLRRNRRAFDVARTCHGARTAAQSGAFPDRASKEAERLVAAIFSSTMREYSAGEHFPHAIMRLRRPTVSHDAQTISIIITGSEVGLRRVRLVISERWPITTETASSDGARSSYAGAWCSRRDGCEPEFFNENRLAGSQSQTDHRPTCCDDRQQPPPHRVTNAP
jgi:hypothetical protein